MAGHWPARGAQWASSGLARGVHWAGIGLPEASNGLTLAASHWPTRDALWVSTGPVRECLLDGCWPGRGALWMGSGHSGGVCLRGAYWVSAGPGILAQLEVSTGQALALPEVSGRWTLPPLGACVLGGASCAGLASQGAGQACAGTTAFADGHTTSNAPDLFQPPKLSGAKPSRY